MGCCIWLIIPGHQKCSHSNDKVWSWPWWPASLWHPFKVVTQWAVGTTNSSKSSVSPWGTEHRYKAPWWITKLCWFCKIIQPSLQGCVLPGEVLNLSSQPSASLILHLVLGPLSGLWPNPLHAFVQVHGLQQHIPLALSDSHSLPWQGCELPPNELLLMLLHCRLFSPCLGPVE